MQIVNGRKAFACAPRMVNCSELHSYMQGLLYCQLNRALWSTWGRTTLRARRALCALALGWTCFIL